MRADGAAGGGVRFLSGRHGSRKAAHMAERVYTALVLAASRGNLDPLAQAGGVSHKCFIDIAGRPMLERVVEAVMASPRVKHVIVAIEPDSMEEAKQILA